MQKQSTQTLLNISWGINIQLLRGENAIFCNVKCFMPHSPEVMRHQSVIKEEHQPLTKARDDTKMINEVSFQTGQKKKKMNEDFRHEKSVWLPPGISEKIFHLSFLTRFLPYCNVHLSSENASLSAHTQVNKKMFRTY